LVERAAVNRLVAGSSPARGANQIRGLWPKPNPLILFHRFRATFGATSNKVRRPKRRASPTGLPRLNSQRSSRPVSGRTCACQTIYAASSPSSDDGAGATTAGTAVDAGRARSDSSAAARTSTHPVVGRLAQRMAPGFAGRTEFRYRGGRSCDCPVAVVPMWHPLRLAEDYAMADILTGGRVILGVARGYHTREVETSARRCSTRRPTANCSRKASISCSRRSRASRSRTKGVNRSHVTETDDF
jgi:Luciferase-like monooxygenase